MCSSCLSAPFASFLQALTTTLTGITGSIQTISQLNGNIYQTSGFMKQLSESLMTVEKPLCSDTASFSSLLWLHQCLCVLMQTGSSFTVSQHWWVPTQQGLADSAVGALRPRASQCTHGSAAEQSALSLATAGWAQALWAGTQGTLCLRAKSCFQVPHGNRGYSRMGVGRPCEEPLSITGDSPEGGCG